MKIDKETLTEEYITNELSMKEIAIKYNMAIGSVFKYIHSYNIPVRKEVTEKSKAKFREKMVGRPSKLRGRKLSKETIEKIKTSKIGKLKNGIGHKKIRKDGYVAVYKPMDTSSNKEGYIMEHRLIMEQYIGRKLRDDEVVHHKNKNRKDNRIENLELMTFKEHARLHMIERHNKMEGVMTY